MFRISIPLKDFSKVIPNGKFTIYGYKWTDDTLEVIPKEAEIVKFMYCEYLKGKSRIEIGRELMAKGIFTRKGKPWVDSNVKHILTNITYTGNMLFQKEYCEDPITKYRKLNHGEFPQYFVENTHEPIIPMYEWQAVQDEIKRRKELGVFGNKSIKTSCFTSKIKCGNCGKSYRRSGKKQRINPDEVYYIWICRTKSEKGAKFCDTKSIPENTLKDICAEVLNLNSFDESVFAERIESITVIGDDTLEFHFTDGNTIMRNWKSTARTDWWTEQRRKAWGEKHKNKSTNPNRNYFGEFTGFIKCDRCGNNYRGQSVTYTDGTKERIWRCCKKCGNTAIKESTLKRLICEVLNLNSFSEEKMDSAIEKVVIQDGNVICHYLDGHTESMKYHEKRKGCKHTDEYKEYMSQLMIERWKNKRSEENDR